MFRQNKDMEKPKHQYNLHYDKMTYYWIYVVTDCVRGGWEVL